MKNVVTMKCVDNSGVYFTSDDRELSMQDFLTIGKEYTGKMTDSGFITIDDSQDTSVFDVERFTFVY